MAGNNLKTKTFLCVYIKLHNNGNILNNKSIYRKREMLITIKEELNSLATKELNINESYIQTLGYSYIFWYIKIESSLDFLKIKEKFTYLIKKKQYDIAILIDRQDCQISLEQQIIDLCIDKNIDILNSFYKGELFLSINVSTEFIEEQITIYPVDFFLDNKEIKYYKVEITNSNNTNLDKRYLHYPPLNLETLRKLREISKVFIEDVIAICQLSYYDLRKLNDENHRWYISPRSICDFLKSILQEIQEKRGPEEVSMNVISTLSFWDEYKAQEYYNYLHTAIKNNKIRCKRLLIYNKEDYIRDYRRRVLIDHIDDIKDGNDIEKITEHINEKKINEDINEKIRKLSGISNELKRIDPKTYNISNELLRFKCGLTIIPDYDIAIIPIPPFDNPNELFYNRNITDLEIFITSISCKITDSTYCKFDIARTLIVFNKDWVKTYNTLFYNLFHTAHEAESLIKKF